MVDNAVTEQYEPEPGVVIWPEPSRLEPWWERVMFGSGSRSAGSSGDALHESTRRQ
ncbi:hypothetical protein IU443_04975 [Nocardia farcinica]|uniref:Uncharacterized protein n=1 Tax=Nocardia farcinica TaxID=37329 RepID=A0A0H5NM85_NOCFR|nr:MULTISPECIES: hypothetical protein [Nocardia]MBA4855544.1 hypothetical protein [Nocardia farcinica]MBC9818117.1 hypothetical protein [Nocardia farcinica]MBF6067840.1 hypothetical protein [Nocardia farcinica]MBF6140310.1 hypothetical protein [Nocardia farcinica]MBF6184631.1 hypothetical protein [Nocardia farcinica]